MSGTYWGWPKITQPKASASDLRCQGCGMSEEIEAPRPLPPDTKPVTEAPTPAQIQEQYGARSEKYEVCEAPITKEEPSHKGCDVVYQNHLGKVISIQQNDLDLSQAAALNGSGWSKVIKCNKPPREKIPWNGLDPPSTVMFINIPVSLHRKSIPWNDLDPPRTAGDFALGWSARTTFCGGLESPIALILTLRRSTGMVWTRQESLWFLTGDSCSFAREKTPITIPEVASLRKQDCGLCDCSLNGDFCSPDRSWSRNAYHRGRRRCQRRKIGATVRTPKRIDNDMYTDIDVAFTMSSNSEWRMHCLLTFNYSNI